MLTKKQISELDIASERKLNNWKGSESSKDTDLKNLEYAYSKGYSYSPKPKTTIPELTSIPELNVVNNNVVSNSDGVKDKATDLANMGADIKETLSGINWDTYIKDLNNRLSTLGSISVDEENQIKQAGRTEGFKYDELIRKAEEEKRLGMAKTNVSAGRMGGFMNTQFAGVSALSPTEGGIWEGAGGTLEYMKSAYDKNISNLQDQKLQAISLAEQAEREYIRTGKKQDFDAAVQLYNTAQDAHNQILSRLNEKQNLITQAQTYSQTKKLNEATNATNQLSLYAQGGKDWNTVSDADKNLLASQLGIDVNTLSGVYNDMLLVSQFEKEGRYADFTKKIADILAQIPAGTKITIGGKEYEGTGTGGTSNLNDLLIPSEASALGVPYGTTKLEASNMGLTPKSTLTGQDKINMEVKLAGNFETYAKESKASVKQLGIMATAWEEIKKGMETGYITNPQTGKQEKFNLNAPSQAMLVTFQKLLDPTSVVRESEYARSGDGQALVQRIEGIYDKLTRGGAGVTTQDLSQFYTLSQELLKNYQKEQLNYAKRIQTQANNYGLNIENILTPDVLDILNTMGINTTSNGSGGEDYSW